jgi:AMP-activated protein kinase-like protein
VIDRRDEAGRDEPLDGRDATIDRVVEALSPLPAVNAAATARILRAVAADGEVAIEDVDDLGEVRAGTPVLSLDAHRAGGRSGPPARRRWGVQVSLPIAAGLALAAGVAGFMARGVVATSGPTAGQQLVTNTTPVESTSLETRLVSNTPDAPQPQQFVLQSPAASSVSLVGDFNDWKGTPMMRDASGAWTATIAIAPGRHVYAYMIDGKQWTLDPRAPRATDSDFGMPGSVVIVGVVQ